MHFFKTQKTNCQNQYLNRTFNFATFLNHRQNSNEQKIEIGKSLNLKIPLQPNYQNFIEQKKLKSQNEFMKPTLSN